MTSILKKAIPLAAGLLLLAGSPAFAARHQVVQEARTNELIAPTYARRTPASWSGSGNSSPYIGQWLEGYPRSSD
jgi:hypothetical protein